MTGVLGRPFTVFVPNRGEIVRRIARSARKMGMRVAVGYSDADANDPFLREVDQAIRLGPAAAAESYLSIPRVLAAAAQCGADLLHPGYGFLAEDPELARAVSAAGIRFVGPSAEVLAQVGSKSACRALAERIGIPVVRGYIGSDQSDETLTQAARQIGYPVLVKPAAGGGGKGITVAHDEASLSESLAIARRIAQSAFGDAELLLERYVQHVRHVEVQVLRDTFGTCVVLGDRDCSTQRRHQKLIEECPAPDLTPAVREEMHACAARLADHVGYVNAGTVEFIVAPDGTFSFIELNPRLQVEHPVTELVWGVDVVEEQLRIALGERVTAPGTPRGHAIEARVCAEDPYADFAPSSGRLSHVRWSAHARVDASFDEGAELTPYYDSLLGKVIVHGEDRASAIAALGAALRETSILGIRTNLPLLRALTSYEGLTSGAMTTDLLERALSEILPATAATDDDIALAAVAVKDGSDRGSPIYLRGDTHAYLVQVEGNGPYEVDGSRLARGTEAHEWEIGGRRAAVALADEIWVDTGEHVLTFSATPAAEEAAEGGADAGAGSSMAGRVASVIVVAGQRVVAGDVVLTLEAMKMEMAIRATRTGLLRLLCAKGDAVTRGQLLFEIEAEPAP